MNNKIFKVIIWRVCSVTITLLLTWLYTGSVREASAFTLVLHAMLVTAHYMFEVLWEKYEDRRLGNKEQGP